MFPFSKFVLDQEPGILRLEGSSFVIPYFGGKGMRPYVAKSYFETYKSYDQIQKIRPVSQNFNEILTFEILEKMRFCHTLTH